MANVIRKGFHPVAGNRMEPRRYTVASGYTPANSHPGIAPGEVVTAVTAGTIEVTAAAATTILGIVASVSYKDTNGNRVTAGYLPAGYTYSGDAVITNPNAPIIMVWDQPDMEYIANVGGAASTLALHGAGTFAGMDINATSSTGVDTVFARSNRQLDGTYVAGTAQFKILELFREPALEYTSTNLRTRCMINEGVHSLLVIGGL
jgi:hypothetical protein